MKKTQIATLKFLYSGDKKLDEIYNELHKIFPIMKTGINIFNVNVLLKCLRDLDYIYIDISCIPFLYSLAPKGKVYVLKLKQWGVNNDK